MSPDKGTFGLSLDLALTLIKSGDINGARSKLGLPSDVVTDQEFVKAMVSLGHGMDLFARGDHPEAVEYLQQALEVINHSQDQEAKFLLTTLASFAQGISKLLGGDAHGAYPLLQISAKAIEDLGFFLPDLRKVAFSCRATCYVALARASMNASDLGSAESWLGKASDQYQQLLPLLDPENREHIMSFVEIYGSKIELATLFAFLDLQVLDFDDMESRLKTVDEDASKLSTFARKLESQSLEGVARVLLLLYSILKRVLDIERHILTSRSPLNKEKIQEVKALGRELSKAKDLAEKSGDRGRGSLFMIDRLQSLLRNLLALGRVGKEDFGRFGGIVSLCSLVLLVLVVQFTIKPTGSASLIYFLGEVIVSLIVGFGYGAIRFRPLLKLYSEVFRSKSK
jgi:tetratricopeptide (TPR) repeat protein